MGGFAAVGGTVPAYVNNPIYQNGIWKYKSESDPKAVPIITSDDASRIIDYVSLYPSFDSINIRGLNNNIICETSYPFNDPYYLSTNNSFLEGVNMIMKKLDALLARSFDRTTLKAELLAISNLERRLESELPSYRSRP